MMCENKAKRSREKVGGKLNNILLSVCHIGVLHRDMIQNEYSRPLLLSLSLSSPLSSGWGGGRGGEREREREDRSKERERERYYLFGVN